MRRKIDGCAFILFQRNGNVVFPRIGRIKITGKNFDKEVLKAKGKVIVDYGAKWCGYCQLLKPIYKEAAKIRGLYKFTDVDADEEEELIESQGIESFPTLHLYENGKLIKVGGYMMNMTVWDLIDWIESK